MSYEKKIKSKQAEYVCVLNDTIEKSNYSDS